VLLTTLASGCHNKVFASSVVVTNTNNSIMSENAFLQENITTPSHAPNALLSSSSTFPTSKPLF